MKLLKGDLKSRLAWCHRAQFALLGILFAGAGTLYLTAIRPALNDLGEVKNLLQCHKCQLEQNQNQVRNLPWVENEIRRLTHRVEKFDKKLPKQQDLAVFIDDVTRFSQTESLRKLSWKPDAKPRKTELYSELPIHFTFDGDFQTGLVKFLRQTEEMPRLTRVQKLDVRSIDGGKDVKADVTVEIFFTEGT
jgi:Tfp pilus assembly protein PilO